MISIHQLQPNPFQTSDPLKTLFSNYQKDPQQFKSDGIDNKNFLKHSLWDRALAKLQSLGIVDAEGNLNKDYLFDELPPLNPDQIERVKKLLEKEKIVITYRIDSTWTEPYKVELTLDEYFRSWVETSKGHPHLNIEDIEIVGSSVLNILGWEYFESIFNEILKKYKEKNGIELTLQDLFSEELIQLIKWELKQKPADIDVRITVPKADKSNRDELKKQQINYIHTLAQQQSDKPGCPTWHNTKDSAFSNLKNIANEGEQVLVCAFNGALVDIQWMQEGLDHLFSRDSVKISVLALYKSMKNKIDKDEIKVVSSFNKGSPFFIDRFTRIIHVLDIDSVNHMGWKSLMSLFTKGFRTLDPEIPKKLLKKAADNLDPRYKRDVNFFNMWSTCIKDHHSNQLHDATVLLLYYYQNLKGVLDPTELAKFEKAAVAHLATLNSGSTDFPLLDSISDDLKNKILTIEETCAALQITGFLSLGRPSTGNQNLAITGDQLEIIFKGTSTPKRYTIRLSSQFETAFKLAGTDKFTSSKLIPNLLNQLQAATAFDPAIMPALSTHWKELKIPIDELQTQGERLLAHSDKEWRKAGFYLLLTIGLFCKQPAVQRTLLTEFPKIWTTLSTTERKEVYERIESLCVDNEKPQFPGLFTPARMKALMEANDESQVKALWIVALATTQYASEAKTLVKTLEKLINHPTLDLDKKLQNLLLIFDILSKQKTTISAALRNRFIESVAHNPENPLNFEQCCQVLDTVISWLPLITDQTEEKRMIGAAFDLLISLVARHGNIAQFEKMVPLLFKAILSKDPKQAKEEYYEFSSETVDNQYSYQNNILNNGSLLIKPIMEKTGRKIDPKEHIFIEYFSMLMQKAIATWKCEKKNRDYLMDFSFINLRAFFKNYSHKSTECLELLDSFVYSVYCPSTEQHPRACMPLILSLRIKGLFNDVPEKLFEYSIIAMEKTIFNLSLSDLKKAEILKRIVDGFLTAHTGEREDTRFQQGLNLLTVTQLVHLEQFHDMRFSCYKVVMDMLRRFPLTLIKDKYVIEGLHSLLMPNQFPYRSLQFVGLDPKKPLSVETVYNTLVYAIDTLINIYHENKEKASSRYLIKLIYLLCNIFAFALDYGIFDKHLKEKKRIIDKLQPIVIELIKSNPSNTLEIIQMFQIIIGKQYGNSPKEKDKFTNEITTWITTLAALSKECLLISAQIAFDFAVMTKTFDGYPKKLEHIKNLINRS